MDPIRQLGEHLAAEGCDEGGLRRLAGGLDDRRACGQLDGTRTLADPFATPAAAAALHLLELGLMASVR